MLSCTSTIVREIDNGHMIETEIDREIRQSKHATILTCSPKTLVS